MASYTKLTDFAAKDALLTGNPLKLIKGVDIDAEFNSLATADADNQKKSALGTGVATFLATPSSANLAAAVTDETGSGALVFANTPTLVTPVIGAATGTSLQITTDSTGPVGSISKNSQQGLVLRGVTGSGLDLTLLNAAGSTDVAYITTGESRLTLPSPQINGTIATTGLTMPALTLGGAITGGGQNVSGLGTLGCGVITSGSGATTNIGWRIGYSGSSGWTGLWSTAVTPDLSTTYVLVNNGGTGSTVLNSVGGSSTNSLAVNGATVASFSSTALTLGSGITSISGGTNPSLNIGTGALTAGSATFQSNALVSISNAGAITEGLALNTAGNKYNLFRSGSTGYLRIQGAQAGFSGIEVADGATTIFSVGSTGTATLGVGLAVTGTLSATGLVSVGGSTPASASATGTAGTITWDSSYIYVCTATDTWKRVAIATW